MNNQEFPVFIKSVKKLYDEYCKEVGDRLNLSRLEIDIVAFLNNNPKRNTARDVAELRMLPKSNVSAGLESLMRKGYVKRAQATNDKRISRLYLTNESGIIRREITKMQENFNNFLLVGVTDDEKSALNKVMAKMSANVLNKGKE